MFALAVALPVLALMVVLMLLVEIRQYRAGRRLLSARRFVLRMVAGTLLVALLAAIFAGAFVLRLTEAGSNPTLFLAFWSGCVLIALSLLGVMMADLKEMRARSVQRQHEIWRDFARHIADTMSPGEGEKKSAAKDRSEDEPR